MSKATKQQPFNLVSFCMDWESEGDDMDRERLIDGFQRMVDSGDVWELQGAYGRQAARMIRQGLVKDTHGVLAHRR